MHESDLGLSQSRSLQPNAHLTRRAFVVTSLGAGFALAVQPVMAQTVITTDSEGLTAGEVKVPVSDGAMPAYRACPAGQKHAPVVLVIHEIFGVHEHIQDLCRRLAKQGYYAIAGDLYARYGDATKVADIKELMSTIVSKASDTQVRSDLDAAVKFAASEKADTHKLAVTGFCWGGRQTWMYTAATPSVKAGVAWYGPLAKAPQGSQTAIEVAGNIKGRVLGLYGGQDQGISQDDVQKMRDALTAAGDGKSTIQVYPDAPHGFNADYRPSYRETEAKDGWARMLAWFKAHGVA
ncbi:MAG: dienelactone hydrolase family protein [Nevskia sp.]|nr:dienelactone hydrolase family protein [Nevskia sp.]